MRSRGEGAAIAGMVAVSCVVVGESRVLAEEASTGDGSGEPCLLSGTSEDMVMAVIDNCFGSSA